MTDLALIEEDKAREEIVIRRAMKAFEVTLLALDAAVDDFKAEYLSGEKEILKDLKAMNSAYQYAMETEQKARERAAKQIGAIHAGTLDLDAAREEIGLRLACLRATGDD